jgi:hypothetical protein
MNKQTPVRRASGHSEAPVERQFVAAASRAQLRHKPFDHIYMEEVLAPNTYTALLAAVPGKRFYHHLRHRDAIRQDGSSTRLRMYLYPELLWRLPAQLRRVWLPIARALCSSELEAAFKTKFRSALEARFGKPAEKIGMYPVPILLRDQQGYKISVHSDVPTKAITVQFYLPTDGSQRHIGTIFHESNEGAGAKKTTQMPFMPSTGYAFPVTQTRSWHSAAETGEEDGERVTMMVTYYVADSPFTWLKYRLRRALLWVRIHPER